MISLVIRNKGEYACSCAPKMFAPSANISNLNILLSGSVIFRTNIQYKFEQLLEENRVSVGLNEGQTTGMSSGLIGQSDFDSGYGFCYINFSRKIS